MKVTDPVCGMQINPERAVATLVYEGVEYWFCTEACKRRFEQDPPKYARAS
jgi:YHS domain-containing protein